ncbi:hypothetical protein AUC69_11060 [Methyloceanibacter superfactus]|uniref:Uncharacterized protein n=1 Tax=Methyloceanibacter superfactus TaxID=1774969 RepID=A0A1E3VVU6_9HYPH|nr:hypothetical protein AUC69_11060 [Methyloceanibacter superfactus]
MRLVGKSTQGHGCGRADRDVADVGLGELGDHPDALVVADAEQLVTRHDPLPFDDVLLDHMAGRGRGPVDRARVGLGLEHLVDAGFGHIEIAQPLHGPVDVAGRVAAPLPALGDQEVDLRQLDLRAVEAEERLALLDPLPGFVDEEILDIAVGADRDDPQPGLIVLHQTNTANGAGDRLGRDLLGSDPAALDLVEADLDGALVIAGFVGVDRDVVHTHGILLRHLRGVGKPHGIAVVKDLAAVFGGRHLLRGGRRRYRLRPVRIPIAGRGAGQDAGGQNGHIAQTLHDRVSDSSLADPGRRAAEDRCVHRQCERLLTPDGTASVLRSQTRGGGDGGM